MAEKYWHRLCVCVILAQIIQWYTELVILPVWGYEFVVYWPKDYFLFYGFPALLGLYLWCWYCIPHCMAFILVFHQMCYYLRLRFKYVNRLLETYQKNKNNQRIHELIRLLDEHNKICTTLRLFNKFWSKALFMDAVLYTSMTLLIIYLGYFSNLDIVLKLFFGSFAITFTFCFFANFLSAASVSSEV